MPDSAPGRAQLELDGVKQLGTDPGIALVRPHQAVALTVEPVDL